MVDERYVRAVHEAAHALMFTLHEAKVVDCVIHSVDAQKIIDEQSCTITGYTTVTELAKVAPETVFSLVVCARAGFDAACRVDVDEATKDAKMDEVKIQKYFDELKLPQSIRAEILVESEKESFALLDEYFEVIERIAAALVEKGKLEGDEVRAIIQTFQ